MSARVRLGIGIGVWLLAAFSVVQLGRMPGDFGHWACGPWGCFPPLQALAAMHLFWLLALMPIAIWVIAAAPARGAWLFGIALCLLGLSAIAIVTTRESLDWLTKAPAEFHRYFGHRVLAQVVMLSDVPILQVIGVGIVCWRIGAKRLREVPRT